ncbi:MAG: CheR family methyltransferase, partial [Bacteroides sp.]|nr:CheR family methyltransferase [Bacteroides sp.]
LHRAATRYPPMEVDEKDIQSFQKAIRDHSEYDFDGYSTTSLRRRLTRILLENDMDMEDLTKQIRADPEFLKRTVKKITVHTTELFRDPDIWKEIRTRLLPSWKEKSEINIWHSGCSTGQEIFSMMMILEDLGLMEKTNIYGSDLSNYALDIARKGIYKYSFNQSYLENFDKVMLAGKGEIDPKHQKHWNKYFELNEPHDAIRMHKFLCSKPVYKKLDLVKDPNLFLVKFDLIVCRNVIIYFDYELQNRVFDLYYNNLNDNGVLLLGVHESIMGPFTRKFKKVNPFYYKQKV